MPDTAQERPLLTRLASRLGLGADSGAVAIALLIGLLAGLANLGFRTTLDFARWLVWDVIGESLGARLGDFSGNFWLIPVIPMVGMAMLVGLERIFPGEIMGYGLPRFLELVNLRGSFLKRRWVALKTLATSVTLGTGLSAGIEGPVVQIGGAVGATVARYTGAAGNRLRVLIGCGSAAAIAATFGAPITGVIFVQEIILLGEYELQTFGLIVLSAATAAVFNLWIGVTEDALIVPEYAWNYDAELALYVVLGLLLGGVAILYIRSIDGFRRAIEEFPLPRWLKAIGGGGLVGIGLLILPWIGGNGYETLNDLHRSSHWAPALLFAIAGAKLLATALTLGAGGAGGVFAPAMVIGGTFGGGFATLVDSIWPGAIAHPGTFVLVGMGALLGASTHAPLTAIFLLLELTGQYDPVLPIMFATIAAILVARSVERHSVDTLELARRGIHLHQGREAGVLRSLFVAAFYDRTFQPVPESMPLADFLHYLPGSRFTYFPVLDADERLLGVITTQDVREVLLDRDVWPVLVVGDVSTTTDLVTVTPRDTLDHALRLFTRRGLERILVVSPDDPRQVLGFLSRASILDAYQKGMMAKELGPAAS